MERAPGIVAPESILAFDVGNTSVAAALFDVVAGGGADLRAIAATPRCALHRVRSGDAETELAFWQATTRSWAPARLTIGAVHRFGAELATRLRAALPAAPLLAFEQGRHFPLARDLDEPGGAGVDRLAAARAAFALAKGAALIVNAGTAITVDWIDASGTFRGGAIVPGRALQARALRLFTDRLPEVAPWSAPESLPLPGRNSEQAIRHGLDVGVPGMVDRLLTTLLARAGTTLPIFVSGGDATWLSPRLASAHRVEPWLVARGLALAAMESAP